ncbi:MAG: 2-hydroxyacyl-CoA dehydratase, partial [Thermodesulfobacteriota bacterium]|nr:2-hydroxyacyl-CoA dehydratase [Thermodesulfobacteriota bacterium]
MIKDFLDIYQNRHRYARDWKEKHPNKKMVGYLCTYAPEELFYAAGILPVRILGSHEPQNVTEPHIFGMFCPFSRDVLAQGLQGRYDYLDAVATAHPCMHLAQVFDSWVLNVTPQSFYVDMPNEVRSPHALPYLVGVLDEFKERLEEWIGKEIKEEEIKAAIDVYNENRSLLMQIYEARKAEAPPISGAEAMYITVGSQFMDKKDSNRLLKEIIEKELPGREAKQDTDTRLMLVGSEDDDIKFIEMVE